MNTPYHANYYAYELTKQGGAGVDRLSRSLFDAASEKKGTSEIINRSGIDAIQGKLSN